MASVSPHPNDTFEVAYGSDALSAKQSSTNICEERRRWERLDGEILEESDTTLRYRLLALDGNSEAPIEVGDYWIEKVEGECPAKAVADMVKKSAGLSVGGGKLNRRDDWKDKTKVSGEGEEKGKSK